MNNIDIEKLISGCSLRKDLATGDYFYDYDYEGIRGTVRVTAVSRLMRDSESPRTIANYVCGLMAEDIERKKRLAAWKERRVRGLANRFSRARRRRISQRLRTEA